MKLQQGMPGMPYDMRQLLALEHVPPDQAQVMRYGRCHCGSRSCAARIKRGNKGACRTSQAVLRDPGRPYDMRQVGERTGIGRDNVQAQARIKLQVSEGACETDVRQAAKQKRTHARL